MGRQDEKWNNEEGILKSAPSVIMKSGGWYSIIITFGPFLYARHLKNAFLAIIVLFKIEAKKCLAAFL